MKLLIYLSRASRIKDWDTASRKHVDIMSPLSFRTQCSGKVAYTQISVILDLQMAAMERNEA